VSVQRLTRRWTRKAESTILRVIPGADTSTFLPGLLLCWVDVRNQYLQVNEVAASPSNFAGSGCLRPKSSCDTCHPREVGNCGEITLKV
jgi:hypothetical protein